MTLFRNIAFGLVMLLYLWYPYTMISTQEDILKTGEIYRFRPQPIDPYDAFRGRYVTLNFGATEVEYIGKRSATLKSFNQEVYVALAKDSLGYAYFHMAYDEPPPGVDYIVTTGYGARGNAKVRVSAPESICYYYMNEELAPQAEKAFQDLLSRRSRDSVLVYLDTRVLDGNILIEQLYMEGMPVEEYLLKKLE